MKCEDKKIYDYYLDAGVVVSFLKNKGKRLWIYLCNDCKKFHLSSKLYKSKKYNRKIYKEMGIYQGKCSQENDECFGDIMFRKKDGPRICEYHYKQ